VMQESADQFLQSTPERADDLIARWFGHKIDFGQV